MTVVELIKVLARFAPDLPVKLAVGQRLLDASRLDIEVLDAPAADGGLALCICPHDSTCARQSRPEVKCSKCGWVHVAIPRHHAEQAVLDANQEHRQDSCLADAALARYFKCFRCGAATDTFAPAGPDDAPVGCTFQPVVVGQRKEGRE